MKRNEFGRSMVEIVVVLAIIAVLSIGGILGFGALMDSRQKTAILNEARLQGIELKSGIFAEENGQISYDDSFSEYIATREYSPNRTYIRLTTIVLPEQICTDLTEYAHTGTFQDIECNDDFSVTFSILTGDESSASAIEDDPDDDDTSSDDPTCNGVTCNECSKCVDGVCVANTKKDNKSCGTNSYCSNGECVTCPATIETCVGSDEMNGACQTRKKITCDGGSYCNTTLDKCVSCPKQKSCDPTTQCCKSTGTDECGQETFAFGDLAPYLTNNDNGCLVEEFACVYDRPSNDTQTCAGICKDGNCHTTCSASTTECATCTVINGETTFGYAPSGTSCNDNAGTCDGNGTCSTCSMGSNCTAMSSASGSCLCTACKSGYYLVGGACTTTPCADFVATSCQTRCSVSGGQLTYTNAPSGTSCDNNTGLCDDNGTCIPCAIDYCETATVKNGICTCTTCMDGSTPTNNACPNPCDNFTPSTCRTDCSIRNGQPHYTVPLYTACDNDTGTCNLDTGECDPCTIDNCQTISTSLGYCRCTQCNDGYTWDTNTMTCQLCAPANCATVSTENNICSCAKCNTGYLWNAVGKACQVCSPNDCTTAEFVDGVCTCTQCNDGYLWNAVGKACQVCSPNDCTTAEFVDGVCTCTQCIDGYKWNATAGQCEEDPVLAEAAGSACATTLKNAGYTNFSRTLRNITYKSNLILSQNLDLSGCNLTVNGRLRVNSGYTLTVNNVSATISDEFASAIELYDASSSAMAKIVATGDVSGTNTSPFPDAFGIRVWHGSIEAGGSITGTGNDSSGIYAYQYSTLTATDSITGTSTYGHGIYAPSSTLTATNSITGTSTSNYGIYASYGSSIEAGGSITGTSTSMHGIYTEGLSSEPVTLTAKNIVGTSETSWGIYDKTSYVTYTADSIRYCPFINRKGTYSTDPQTTASCVVPELTCAARANLYLGTNHTTTGNDITYKSGLTLTNDVDLSGCNLTVNGELYINGGYTLTANNVSATPSSKYDYGIYLNGSSSAMAKIVATGDVSGTTTDTDPSYYGIYARYGSIEAGGSITGTANAGYGIYAYYGSTLTATDSITGTSTSNYGIYDDNANVTYKATSITYCPTIYQQGKYSVEPQIIPTCGMSCAERMAYYGFSSSNYSASGDDITYNGYLALSQNLDLSGCNLTMNGELRINAGYTLTVNNLSATSSDDFTSAIELYGASSSAMAKIVATGDVSGTTRSTFVDTFGISVRYGSIEAGGSITGTSTFNFGIYADYGSTLTATDSITGTSTSNYGIYARGYSSSAPTTLTANGIVGRSKTSFGIYDLDATVTYTANSITYCPTIYQQGKYSVTPVYDSSVCP